MLLALHDLPRSVDPEVVALAPELRAILKTGGHVASLRIRDHDMTFALRYDPAEFLRELARTADDTARVLALDVFVACTLTVQWDMVAKGAVDPDTMFLSLLSLVANAYSASTVIDFYTRMHSLSRFVTRVRASPGPEWVSFVVRSREDVVVVTRQAFHHKEASVARDLARFASDTDVFEGGHEGLLYDCVLAALALPSRRVDATRACAVTDLLCAAIARSVHVAVVVRDVLCAEGVSRADAHPLVLAELVAAVQRSVPYLPFARDVLARASPRVARLPEWRAVTAEANRVATLARASSVDDVRWTVPRR